MKVIEYQDIDRAEWSALVQSSSTGTWFQTPEAYSLYASMPDLFRPFAIAVERVNELTNEGTLCGACVGYVTVEKSALRQFLTRRAIIVGGPALADDCTNEEVEFLMEAVRKQPILNPSLKGRTSNLSSPLKGRERLFDPIYIETRNFNDYSKWRGAFEKAGFEYKKHLNFHIDCTDREAMEVHLSENRKRQIKRAIKSGVEIKSEGISELEIKEWYEILKDLYTTKVKTPLFPLSFFLEYYRQGLGKYLLVKYEGKVIGGIMCPILDGKCIYEWYICGSDGEYKEQYPSVMATWAAMDYAAKHGLARFDVMGVGEPGVPYGVRDFKVEFGGELVEHGRFIHVCKPWLYEIGKLGVRMMRYRR